MIELTHYEPVYVVYCADGYTETFVCNFKNEAHAAHYAYVKNGNNKFGHFRFRKELLKPIIIFESLEEVERENSANLRKSALAKLTKEERVALGLQ